MSKANPKGPCAQIVYTLALKCLYRDYIKAKVDTIWVHGPLGNWPETRLFVRQVHITPHGYADMESYSQKVLQTATDRHRHTGEYTIEVGIKACAIAL